MDLVTVATFSNYLDAIPYQLALENAGISCVLKDEHSVTITPYLSNAIGGVKLQVTEHDYEAAKKMLKQQGYTFGDEDKLPAFWRHFDNISHKLPFIGKKKLFTRFLLILITFSLIIISALVYINQPTIMEVITARPWCVYSFSYKGREINPLSLGAGFVLNTGQNCREKIEFAGTGASGTGNIQLPGINTYNVEGYWRINTRRDSIFIGGLDTLKEIYEGWYHFEINGPQLILESQNTLIYCEQEKELNFHF